MSDTTAFLAGSAVAGVAALLMLKSGGISLSQPELAQSYVPPAAVAPAAAPSPSGSSSSASDREVEALLRSQLDANKSSTEQLKIQLEQQKFLTEQLKLQLEQQQESTAQLKSQLDDQRQEATAVIDRLREQQRSMDMLTLQQALPKESDTQLLDQAQFLETLQTRNQGSSAQVVMLWALGGILLILIVGGGVILVSVIVILIQQQRKPPRPPMPVIHQPIPLPLPYAQPTTGYRRSPLLLPPSVRRSSPNPPASQPSYNPYNPYNPYPSEGQSPNVYRDWED